MLTPAQQQYLNARRTQPIVGGVDFATGATMPSSAWGAGWDAEAARYERNNASRAAHNRLVNIGRIASAVPLAFAAAPAIGAVGGSGGVASVPGAVGASAAPLGAGTVGVGGGAMTFGNLLRLGELGVGLGASLFGQRAQNRALDRDSTQRSQEFAAQMAMLQQQNEFARQQWDADQAQRAQEFALAQEDRTRRIRLEDEREARAAPFRQARADALIRLRDLMTLGRR